MHGGRTWNFVGGQESFERWVGGEAGEHGCVQQEAGEHGCVQHYNRHPH